MGDMPTSGQDMPAGILTPDCPLCGEAPFMVMGGGTQAFCGNDTGCPVLTWDPSVSREANLANMKPARWEPTGEDGADGD